jgi:hypothetical protein
MPYPNRWLQCGQLVPLVWDLAFRQQPSSKFTICSLILPWLVAGLVDFIILESAQLASKRR